MPDYKANTWPILLVFAACVNNPIQLIEVSGQEAYDLEIRTTTGVVLRYAERREGEKGCYQIDECLGAIESLVAEQMAKVSLCPNGYTIVSSGGFFYEVSKVVIPVKCASRSTRSN